MMKMLRGPARYAAAVLIVAAAVGLASIPEHGKGLASVLYLAVFLAAWFGGLGPGLLATSLITFIATFGLIFVEPDHEPWRIVAVVLFLAGGVLITLVVQATHAARRGVEASQRWLTAVLTSIGDAVIVADASGRAAFLNPVARSLTGWDSDEVLGRPLTEVLRICDEETGKPVACPVDEVLNQGLAVGLVRDSVLVSRDGTERSIENSGAPIRGSGEVVTGVVLVFRDVTDRKRLEAELRKQADELRSAAYRKDEFLAMLAHELRNPIAAIDGAVRLMTQSGAAQDVEWSREVIDRNVRLLARLITDLLDVSRITHGKIELRKDLVSLAAIINRAVGAAGPLLKERNHELQVFIPEGTLWLEADATRLEQVLLNLLTNAAQHAGNGTRISLSAEGDGEEIVIAVRDNGAGIPPDLLPHVFDLFTQGDRSLARTEGGLGIGLTMVKKLTEMHGGTVTARTEGPGRGCEFLVRMPAARHAVPAPSRSTAPAPAKPKSCSRILVVDDNVDLTRSMAELLALCGYEVNSAYDGVSAIQEARAHHPDVVLLDIGLPGMDGYEVAKRLRFEEGLQEATIIAITGYGQEEDGRKSRDAGFNHHLVKPVEHEVLLSLLAMPKRTG